MSKVVKISLNQVKRLIHEQIEEQNFLRMNEKQRKKFLLERTETVLNVLTEVEEKNFPEGTSEETKGLYDTIKSDQDYYKTKSPEGSVHSGVTRSLFMSLDKSILPLEVAKEIEVEIQRKIQEANEDLASLNNHGSIAAIVKAASCLLVYMPTLSALFMYRKLISLANSLKESNNSTSANERIKERLSSLLPAIQDMKFSQVGTFLKTQHEKK
jgi:hypothetical protein